MLKNRLSFFRPAFPWLSPFFPPAFPFWAPAFPLVSSFLSPCFRALGPYFPLGLPSSSSSPLSVSTSLSSSSSSSSSPSCYKCHGGGHNNPCENATLLHILRSMVFLLRAVFLSPHAMHSAKSVHITQTCAQPGKLYNARKASLKDIAFLAAKAVKRSSVATSGQPRKASKSLPFTAFCSNAIAKPPASLLA